MRRFVIDANTLASGSIDIALAREGGAEAIVTGDKDLLDHDGLEPAAISPREACELLGLI